MASYKQYTNRKDNKKYYEFTAYLGTDPMTGKRVRVRRRRSKSTGQPFRNKKEAKDEVVHLQKEFDVGGFEAKEEREKKDLKTYKDVAIEWLETRYKHTVQDSTYLATRHTYFEGYILPEIGNYKLEVIDKVVLEPIIEKWHEEFVGQRYKLSVNYMEKVFDYAVKEELLQKSPMKKVFIPIGKTPPKKKSKFYDRDELNEFLEACSRHGHASDGDFWNTLFHFLAFSGLRIGETLALTWEDIELDIGIVNVNKTLSTKMGKDGVTERTQHDMTKNGEDRLVTIDDLTVDKLSLLKESEFITNELVFPPLRSKKEKWMFNQQVEQ